MLIKHELILRDELAKPVYAADIAAGAWQKIADTLNARASIPNPTPRPTVPKRLSVEDFVTLLKPADRVTVFQNAALVQEYRTALEGGQRAYSKKLWAALKTLVTDADSKAAIDADSKAAIDAALDATELDPAWTATVLAPSIAMGLGIPAPTADDVQFVVFRHRGA